MYLLLSRGVGALAIFIQPWVCFGVNYITGQILWDYSFFLHKVEFNSDIFYGKRIVSDKL
jgi:hypothetical protein